MKKIAVCAVPYSDNLGDGVIFDTLSRLIRKISKDATVVPLDIAGRSGFGASSLKSQALVRIFDMLPAGLRRAFVLALFTLKFLRSWRREWECIVGDADRVVIGGGQLFSDVDLNFPVKLYLLSTLLKGKRCSVLFVGVAGRWSPLGRFLVRRFIANARPESWVVRDQQSLENLGRAFGVAGAQVRVAPDPVVALGKVYRTERGGHRVKRLGVGVTDPRMLAYSAARSTASVCPSFDDAYSRVASCAAALGWEVLLFTNGAREDNDYMETLRNGSPALASLGQVVPRSPSELVEVIAGCGAVVAHRMHAGIIAYALGVPSLGFAWDDKVSSFFALTGRDKHLFGEMSDERFLEVLSETLRDPVSATLPPEPLAELVTAELSSQVQVWQEEA